MTKRERKLKKKRKRLEKKMRTMLRRSSHRMTEEARSFITELLTAWSKPGVMRQGAPISNFILHDIVIDGDKVIVTIDDCRPIIRATFTGPVEP